jgi:hypothetical protein
MTDFAERRRFPRVSARTAVHLTKLDASQSGDLSLTKTIGLGGCLVIHEGPLGIGTSVRLVFYLKEDVAEARGRVVYETERAGGWYDVGVEFVDLPTLDRAVLEGLFEPDEG